MKTVPSELIESPTPLSKPQPRFNTYNDQRNAMVRCNVDYYKHPRLKNKISSAVTECAHWALSRRCPISIDRL